MSSDTRIRFDNIRIIDSQRIELDVISKSKDGVQNYNELWFQFSQPLVLNDDAISVALATLCGKAYSAIHIDLAPSNRAVDNIARFSSASITTASSRFSAEAPRQGLVLNFSGGFDSLAALSLMPEETKLVSLDFGGRFGRERLFFEKFNTITVQTNLLNTQLHRNSWAFMGIGAILTSMHTRAEYQTFGSILEAGPDNMRVWPAAADNNSFPPFAAAGFSNAPYVSGLTEIGTLLVLMRYHRDQIRESLTSVASPGEEKLYRKQVLTQVVAERVGLSVDIDLTPKPTRPHFAFGDNFALDFLSLYVGKYGGRSVADDLLRDIPTDVMNAASKLDLTFFERANSTLFANFPAPLVGGLAAKLAAAGIPFYTEKDFVEFSKIRELLAPYHPVVTAP